MEGSAGSGRWAEWGIDDGSGVVVLGRFVGGGAQGGSDALLEGGVGLDELPDALVIAGLQSDPVAVGGVLGSTGAVAESGPADALEGLPALGRIRHEAAVVQVRRALLAEELPDLLADHVTLADAVEGVAAAGQLARIRTRLSRSLLPRVPQSVARLVPGQTPLRGRRSRQGLRRPAAPSLARPPLKRDRRPQRWPSRQRSPGRLHQDLRQPGIRGGG